MHITDFDYDLPDELIAQEPLKDRQNSRMLVIDRASGNIADENFSNLTQCLRKGDVMVVNNTKVFPARLFGTSETGANIEVFLIEERKDEVWLALARPARRLQIGKKIVFDDLLRAEVIKKTNDGKTLVRFEADGNFDEILDAVGKTPLPPYIKRGKEGSDADRERYQTVFAKHRGAIAAPTAGLHFSREMFRQLADCGVKIAEITLHVGYGTFEPVRVNDLSKHSVMPERYEIGREAADILNQAKADTRRIFAVGTTTTRALEMAVLKHGIFATESGLADLTITPGFKFKAVDALLTNYHLPQSSLLFLVSTFGGHELIMKAYRHAVAKRYRFYSYGDCMLIL